MRRIQSDSGEAHHDPGERGGAPPPGRGHGGPSRLQLLLLVGLLAASVLAAAVALGLSREQADAETREQIERAEGALERQVAQARGALLGLRGLFAASDEVTQDEFARFAAPSLGRSGLQSLFAAEVVAEDARAGFEAVIGRPITSLVLEPEPGLAVAQRRGAYRPLRFLAPFPASARQVIGIDLLSVSGVADALDLARDSGRTVAAPPFSVGAESPGLILVGAHYRPGARLGTVEQRRAAFRGYTGAFYKAEGFAQAALDALPPGAGLSIFDGERQLHGPVGEVAGGIDRIVSIAGRAWRLNVAVDNTPSLALPATILGAGTLLTALVALLFVLGNRRERAVVRAEGELRHQVGVNRAVLDAAPDGISLVDLEGRTLLQNPAMGRLVAGITGRPRLDGTIEEQAQAAAPRFIGAADVVEIAAALRADPTLTREDELETTDGKVLRQFSAPVRMGGEDGPISARIFLVRDVTVERRMERMKDEFIALASHELRTPLTSILGYLEALREGDAGELAPEQERFLGVIARNGDRLRHLVDDLLDVARADAGQLALATAEVDLGEVVAEASQAARPAAVERGIALEVAAPAGALVTGDRTRLGQVVDNLVSNALKFTPPGGTVAVTVASSGGMVSCEVSDSGAGIPAGEQERLFERFYRGSRAAADAVQGSGLGLAIAKMIVEGHGGRIELTSAEGRGTRVRFTLPATSPAAPPVSAEATPFPAT